LDAQIAGALIAVVLEVLLEVGEGAFVGGTLAPFAAVGSEDSRSFDHVEKRSDDLTFGDGFAGGCVLWLVIASNRRVEVVVWR
jgi:hypothetical protein